MYLTALITVALVMIAICPLAAQDKPPAKPANRRPTVRTAPDGLFRLLDKDRNGSLSRDEMGAASAALLAMDANEDGFVSPEEMRAMMDRRRGQGGRSRGRGERPGGG